MKQFSAQYIFTNSGQPLKRGIITTDDDGVIFSVEDTGGSLSEKQSVEFHNGIIIPGFVNSHCHLELSHLKGSSEKGIGLGSFIEQVRNKRDTGIETIINAAKKADDDMSAEGVVLCADISNTSATFIIKSQSRIKYINLLEVFGIDPLKAQNRIDEILKVADLCASMRLQYYIVPHAVYSTSLPLFRLIKEQSSLNKVSSMHFMENEGEKDFVSSPTDAVLQEITSSGNLILVHNTFADRETVDSVNKRDNIFWCLCPGSNLYIEDKLPPVYMLHESGCEIVTGTDSLASNNRLSILDELKILQDKFPLFTLEEIIRWATLNGARALGESENYGSIEPGKKPGLLLLCNTDLINLRLLPKSSVKRLI